MRLYLDANSIIYSVEGVPAFRLAALDWIERAQVAQGVVITSRLSRLECRVKPLREGNAELLERFEGFFSREGLELVEVSAAVIEQATELRARHNFRAPDAVQLATAILAKSRRLPDGRPEPRAMPWAHGRGAERPPGRLVKEQGGS